MDILKIRRIKSLILSSTSIEEADRIIRDNANSSKIEDRINFLKILFDSPSISYVTDETLYGICLYSLINF